MTAAERPQDRARSLATSGLARTWPKAAPETIARLVRASTVVEGPTGTLLEQGVGERKATGR